MLLPTKRLAKDSLACLINRGLRLLTGRSFSLNAEAWRFVKPSFSQSAEDLLILEACATLGLDRAGFYVDVGAFHPIWWSNTFLLHQRGWRGINIDANPARIEEFRRARPGDINLQVAISDKEGTLEWLEYGSEATNRLAEPGTTERRSLLNEEPRRSSSIRTRRLDQVLAEHVPVGANVDLLNVDCEGHDLEVLRSVDWSRHRPAILVVEDSVGEGRSEVGEFCRGKGYRLFAQANLTGIYCQS